MEFRVRGQQETDDRKQGFLGEVMWDVLPHFRVGGGYNFTDFSEDLTDLSYDHHGFFLNFTGSL